MKRKITVIFLFFILQCIYGQNTHYIDSLTNVAKASKDIKTKINCYNLISKEYITNAAFDSINYYANKALSMSRQINYDIGSGNSYTNLAAIEYDKGNNDKAMIYYSRGLEYFKKANFEIGIARVYTSLGNIYINSGNYSKSLETYIKSLQIIDRLLEKDSNSINLIQTKANNLNNVGNVYFYLNNPDEVLNYYSKAQRLYTKINDKQDLASLLNNIGLIYRVKGDTVKSINYRLKAIEVFKEINNVEGLAYCNLGLGNLFNDLKHYNKSIYFYKESLKYYQQMNSKKGTIMIYINLSEIFRQNNEFSKSISYLDTSLKLSLKINNNDLRKDIYKSYSDVYKSMRNYKLSLEYQTLYINIKDSIFTSDNQKAIAEMQTKYDTEKKEKEILLLNQNKIIREADMLKKSQEIQKQKIIIYAFILGFIVIILFSTLLYKQFHAKKIAYMKLEKQHKEIQQKNEEISAQRDEIESQRDEITAQRDLVMQQKEEIEDIHEKVTSSIRYAERIQHAMLPTEEMSKMLLANYFILFKPRDIVSGDFYWTMLKKEWLYIAVADCTGHGVPGAFMSMLGISLLNEIIAQNESIKANQILVKLRKLIIKSLKQSSHNKQSLTENDSNEISGYDSSGIKDGMDIGLVVINLENYQLQFSGANNPVYIVRKSESIKAKAIPSFVPIAIGTAHDNDRQEENQELFDFRLSDCQLYELKGDKMPIAIYERMSEYENHEINLNRSDVFYLTTDGYADQFGGRENKKMYRKQLKNILTEINSFEMLKQKEILEQKLNEWKGKNEQTDDITIVGVKI